MDKDKAMERLDAIEREAAELRRIIDGKKIEYKRGNVYVGIKNSIPYLLVSDGQDRMFRFNSFSTRLGDGGTEQGWSPPDRTGQRCIDSHLADGFEIYEFNDTRKAFQFFMDHLK